MSIKEERRSCSLKWLVVVSSRVSCGSRLAPQAPQDYLETFSAREEASQTCDSFARVSVVFSHLWSPSDCIGLICRGEMLNDDAALVLTAKLPHKVLLL